jgi:hypothetical protein
VLIFYASAVSLLRVSQVGIIIVPNNNATQRKRRAEPSGQET